MIDDVLRAEQAERVAPLVGQLLDAWDQLSNDAQTILTEDASEIVAAILAIRRAQEGADLAGDQP
jgi:hypothetical protein